MSPDNTTRLEQRRRGRMRGQEATSCWPVTCKCIQLCLQKGKWQADAARGERTSRPLMAHGELQLRYGNHGDKCARTSNDAVPIFGPCKTQGQHEKVCEPQWIGSCGRQTSSVVLPTLDQNRAGLVIAWTTKLIQHACKTWMICLHHPCFANGQLPLGLAASQPLTDDAPRH